MSSWLYQEILRADDLRVPTLARQATINWMRALYYEICRVHGSSSKEQFESCLIHFKSVYAKKLVPVNKGSIFESLYSSLNYSLALQTSASAINNESWVLPSSIVSWYYSIYFSVISMFGSTNQAVDDNHASVYRAFGSNLGEKMPYPFDMKAAHIRNEDYSCAFPNYPSASSFSLSKTFPETQEAARGMLLEYLSGNAKYYTGLTKDRIIKKGPHKDFRSKAAKEERNRQLQKTIAFMHCAFRYRGKANYRDSIYLTYGQSGAAESKEFMEKLTAVSRFFFLIGLALAYRTSLKSDVEAFVIDIDGNLKGVESLDNAECFWRVL